MDRTHEDNATFFNPGGPPGGDQSPRPDLSDAIRSLSEWFAKRQQDRGKKKPPRGSRGPRSRRGRIILTLALAVPVILILVSVLVGVWTDLLWFREVGFTQVFWTRILATFLTGLAGGVLFFAIFASNVFLAWRLSPKVMVRGASDEANPVLEVIEQVETRGVKWILLAVSVVVAFFFALSAGGAWKTVLLFFNRTPFGWKDPVFHRDASFFVFVLPMARWILGFVAWSLIITFIGVVALYLIDQAIRIKDQRSVVLAPHVKAHLSVLAACFLLLKGIDYVLQVWELDYSTRGVVFGASYTDVHAELPVLYLLAAVAVISGILFLVNIRYRGWRLPLIAVGLLIVMWVGAGKIYPALVQQYRVSPNEVQTELPYIEDNINSTRWAFGLDKVLERPYVPTRNLNAADIAANGPTVNNIRLWDTRPLLSTYQSIQELRPYYAITDVDVDRYMVDGRYRQVMLAARELDQEGLPAQAKTWVNQHMTYTHGYGAVFSAVNEATVEGLPIFFIKDIPPLSDTNLVITRPSIYFGEVGNTYVLVKTLAKEFDYPRGNDNVFTDYKGTGGVSVGSFLRRAAFSWRFGTLKILLANSLGPDSRIMFRRTIQERAPEIAPFLSYDKDPYLVIRDDGTLVWIWDAYTKTGRFPYSQPRPDGTNYIRNSIKIVIDPFNGGMTFYQIDPTDAIANTWNKVFPGIFTPGAKMPQDIRRHLRYPEDMFTMQAQVFATYHMTDPQVFYNKEDVWTVPVEVLQNQEIPVTPYYVIMGLPDAPKERFLLLQPFSPLGPKNMIAWMAGGSDGADYGKILVYRFPKDANVYGPAQVESTISNTPAISAQLTLWDQSGSRVIRGNLLVIPIQGSLLYVEPLYLQAEQSPLPELKRVIVTYVGLGGPQVVMENTLGDALQKLFGGGAPSSTTSTAPPTTGTTTPGGTTTTTTAGGTVTTGTTQVQPPTTGTTTPGAPLPTDRASLVALAQQTYQQALTAQQRGDWAEYGRQIQVLGRIITALQTAR